MSYLCIPYPHLLSSICVYFLLFLLHLSPEQLISTKKITGSPLTLADPNRCLGLNVLLQGHGSSFTTEKSEHF